MTPRKQVLKYLEQEPRFRERRAKNRGIGNLLQKNHPSLQNLSKELLESIVDETLSMDRAWRFWLEERNRPDLRGKDYNGNGHKTKQQLEQERQIDLEYEPRYYEDIKCVK